MKNVVSDLFALAGLLIIIAAPAWAGGLAPKKPSDLRTVLNFTTGCPSNPQTLAIDRVINPADASVSAFSVPVGSVFVITSWDWRSNGGTAGALASAVISLDNGTFSIIASRASAIADSSGDAGGTVDTPAGIVVKSGITLCADSTGPSISITVHGFVTKDK